MYMFQDPRLLWNSIDRTADDFVYSTRYQKEREACLIALFAVGYELLTKTNSEVRLVNNREPIEAELRTKTEHLGFQIAMAIRKGRKIKDEYQNSRKLISYRPIKFEEFAERIEDIIAKKFKKYGNGKGINLLIYGNISYEHLNAQTMVDRFTNFASKFDSIWLIAHTFVPTSEGITTGYAIIKLTPNPSPQFYGFTDDGMGIDKALGRHGIFI